MDTGIDSYESPMWAYCSIFKALLTRLLFMAHAGVAVWRVTVIYENDIYWALACTLIPLVVEVIYVMLRRHGAEWKLWYCPSFLFYLLSVVPCIWYLELNKLDILAKEQSQNATSTLITNIDIPGLRTQKITYSSGEWVNGVEQSLMVLLILGRWLLPKGDLSHEQVSQILFVYLAYASDILELLEIFKEKAILEQTELVYGTLLAYTISLLQFVLIFTSVGVTKRARNVNTFIAFVTHRDVTAAVIELGLQDIPFITVRMISIIGYNIITYTNVFFACKNGLVILLQAYRLYVIWQKFKLDDYRPDIPQPLPEYEDVFKTSRVNEGEPEPSPHGQAGAISNVTSDVRRNEGGAIAVVSQSIHKRKSALNSKQSVPKAPKTSKPKVASLKRQKMT
ncbi:transmembrane protein 26-like isoform X1 [Watersipora subatra]|uniref:transmembrane protein 26-like isoform X1 n=1 Tax=Watersipora subatra TaxID=2589382 RepID=UPI00355B3E33